MENKPGNSQENTISTNVSNPKSTGVSNPSEADTDSSESSPSDRSAGVAPSSQRESAKIDSVVERDGPLPRGAEEAERRARRAEWIAIVGAVIAFLSALAAYYPIWKDCRRLPETWSFSVEPADFDYASAIEFPISTSRGGGYRSLLHVLWRVDVENKGEAQLLIGEPVVTSREGGYYGSAYPPNLGSFEVELEQIDLASISADRSSVRFKTKGPPKPLTFPLTIGARSTETFYVATRLTLRGGAAKLLYETYFMPQFAQSGWTAQETERAFRVSIVDILVLLNRGRVDVYGNQLPSYHPRHVFQPFEQVSIKKSILNDPLAFENESFEFSLKSTTGNERRKATSWLNLRGIDD
jgi:hypothetical protein